MPRLAPRVVAFMLAIVLAAGCHDSSGPRTPYDRLTGAWVSNGVSLDEVGGAGHDSFASALRLDMRRDGRYAVREDASVIDSGTVALRDDSLHFHSVVAQGTDADFAMSWRFDGATLVLAQPVLWDFDGDALGPVPARATYRFDRP